MKNTHCIFTQHELAGYLCSRSTPAIIFVSLDIYSIVMPGFDFHSFGVCKPSLLASTGFLLFILFSSAVNGQITSPINTPKSKVGMDQNCIYNNKYSESQRLGFYPLNVSDTIKLISFRYHKNDYPVQRGHIVNDSILEVRILNETSINKLTDILYNYVSNKQGNIRPDKSCFEPRNAILFIDRVGQVREYALISFSCDQFEISSNRIEKWDPCFQKSQMILRLFVSTGIKYGTDLAIHNYPGED